MDLEIGRSAGLQLTQDRAGSPQLTQPGRSRLAERRRRGDRGCRRDTSSGPLPNLLSRRQRRQSLFRSLGSTTSFESRRQVLCSRPAGHRRLEKRRYRRGSWHFFPPDLERKLVDPPSFSNNPSPALLILDCLFNDNYFTKMSMVPRRARRIFWLVLHGSKLDPGRGSLHVLDPTGPCFPPNPSPHHPYTILAFSASSAALSPFGAALRPPAAHLPPGLRLRGAGRSSAARGALHLLAVMNTALVFIKPHAVNDAVVSLAKTHLAAAGIEVLKVCAPPPLMCQARDNSTLPPGTLRRWRAS